MNSYEEVKKAGLAFAEALEKGLEEGKGQTMTNAEKFREVFGYEPATDAVVCNKEDWCGASEPCKYCDCYSDAIGREEDWWGKEYKACFEIKPEFEGVE